VDEEAAVVHVVGVEGHAEQALLSARAGEGADVQERSGQDRPVLDDLDAGAVLLDHEQPLEIARGGTHPQGRGEARGDELDGEILSSGRSG
jgi:hypothetical protein